MPTLSFSNLGDVMSREILVGTIQTIDPETDTCTVTVNGSVVSALLFYHCRQDSVLRDNGAIQGAAAGFSESDQVVVIRSKADDTAPVYVVGHVDGIRACTEAQFILIYGDYCIVWDIGKAAIKENVPTNDSAPGSPVYAEFPCLFSSISNWYNSLPPQSEPWQQTHKVIPLWTCGRLHETGTYEQICEYALDAEGLQDICTSTGLVNDYDVKSYNEWGASRLFENELLSSAGIPVEDLNSAIWHRVHYQYHSESVETSLGSYWWGVGAEASGYGETTYSFYAAGEPFGIPLDSCELTSTWYASTYNNGGVDPPWGRAYRKETVHTERVRPRKNSYSVEWDGFYRNVATPQIFYTSKSILHITYLAYFIETIDNSFDLDYSAWEQGLVEIPVETRSYSDRIEKVRVNLFHSKDGYGGSYDLRHIPEAPTELAEAIKSLVHKVWEVVGVPSDATAASVSMSCRFIEG